VTWTQPYHLLLKWRIERLFRRRQGSMTLPPVRHNDGRHLSDLQAHLTWIGHATFLLRLGHRFIAIDPVWRKRIYYLRRLNDPGVPLYSVPPVHIVAVTHNHYDHLDLPTLRMLDRCHGPLFLAPRGNGAILRRAGIRRIVELDWWECHRDEGLEVTLVPTQHWSQRGPFDKNRALWGGYIFRSREGTAYHAGDTAFEPGIFREIADRYPDIDWAMLPIGAYDPEWFLSTQHMIPEDAGRAFELLEARVFVPMHYGTFALTDEPVGEPLERLTAWFHARRLPADRLWRFDIGETRRLRT
jgi:L-ascorbate metabolism protein UlaG (beta-lactamase superfamily)